MIIDFSNIDTTSQEYRHALLIARMINTRYAMDKPGFDFDGIDPENARRELEEEIRRMEG